MQAQQVDIAIGGGGLAGSLMAVALAQVFQQGLSIAIYDPAPRFAPSSDDPRAYAISAASQHMLDVLGIWDDVAGEAQPVHEIRLTDSPVETPVRRTLLTYHNEIEDDLTGDRVPASWIIASSVLEEAAQAAVVAARSIRRVVAPIEDFKPGAGGSGLRLIIDGAPVTSRLLIAADGSGSRLRTRAGIRTTRRAHKQTALVAVVAHSRPHDGVAVQHFLPGGPFAILPMTGNRSCVTWSENEVVAKRIMAGDDALFLSELEHRFGGQLGALKLASQRRSFPLETRLARSLIAERFALIGDAAHKPHPIAGQGLNLGLRDIAALTECIADGVRVGLDVADPSVLERYQRWRRFDTVTSASAFAALNGLFSSDVALLRSAREFGLGMVDRMPGVKRRLTTEAAGLSGDVPKLLRGLSI